MKIGNAILSEGDRRSLRDLSKILDWSVKWEMPFNINKCQILQVGTRNIKNDYEMRGVKLTHSKILMSQSSFSNSATRLLKKQTGLWVCHLTMKI